MPLQNSIDLIACFIGLDVSDKGQITGSVLSRICSHFLQNFPCIANLCLTVINEPLL